MKNEKVPSERGFGAWLAKVLASEKWTKITIPIFAIILTLIVSSILLLILGKNPLAAFASFFQGNGFAPKENYGAGAGMISDFFAFLDIMAPMILAALAFIFAYKCGLFNIGIAGQMLGAGFLATIFIGYNKSLPAIAAKPLVILVGLLVGGLLGALVGFLKYKFNIHEVVSTIMINYIISYLTGFYINAKIVDNITRSSKICSAASRLTYTKVNIGGYYCDLPIGIIIAILVAFLVKFIFDRTVFGFELKAVGSNRNCATYAGVNVGKSIVSSMMISGMLAGLAGVTYYLGYTNTMIPKTLASMGYDAIATALLGNSSPVGAILASVLITIFQNGSNYMSSMIGVAKEIASVITGILLLFSACGGYFRFLAKSRMEKIAGEKAEQSRKASEAAKGGNQS